MNRSRRFERLLRWYPARWRERYRREMVALLEDTYGSRRIPWSARVSLMKNGSLERARGVGWVGDVASPSDRLKAGSTLIVTCWSLFVVAGAIFAKFSEHWNVLTPVADRPAANVGYNAVQWSGVVGVGLVGLGALLVLPIFEGSCSASLLGRRWGLLTARRCSSAHPANRRRQRWPTSKRAKP